jgi:hypothetical protein
MIQINHVWIPIMSIPSILSKYSRPPPSRSPGRLNFQSWQLPPFVNFVRFCKKLPLALFAYSAYFGQVSVLNGP